MKAPSQRMLDVLIAGRGPVGLALAIALDRAGLSVALVGPSPVAPKLQTSHDWDPRVYALSSSTLALLKELHVWDLVDLERVAPVYAMKIFSDAGADAQSVDFNAYSAGLDALAQIIEHRNLTQALERALRFRDIRVIEGGVGGGDSVVFPDHVEWGAEPTSPEPLRARLLIGADGARSRIRAAMGLDGAQHEYDQHAVVANFLGEHSHLDTARQWFGDDGVLALLPLPLDAQRRGRMSLVWSVSRERAAELMALTPEGLAAIVSNAVHGQFGRFEPLSSAQCLPLVRLSASSLVAPRVALVGDAGHVIHPMAGQGMNLGFGDVATLARVLGQREAERDCGEITLLRRYARARAEPVLAMTLATDGLYRMFYQAPAQIAPLRNLAFRALNQLAFAKRWMVTQAAGSISS